MARRIKTVITDTEKTRVRSRSTVGGGRGYGVPARLEERGSLAPGTAELQEATSKYGRKYGWQRRVLRTEFRGTTPRNSGGPNLISWHSHEIGVRISYGGRLLHEIRPNRCNPPVPRSPCLSRYGVARRHKIPGAGT